MRRGPFRFEALALLLCGASVGCGLAADGTRLGGDDEQAVPAGTGGDGAGVDGAGATGAGAAGEQGSASNGGTSSSNGTGNGGTSSSNGTGQPAGPECSVYAGQPSESVTLELRNDRITPIYIKPYYAACDEVEPSLIDIEDGTGAHVDTRGAGMCGWPPCGEAQVWGFEGPFPCDCALPRLMRLEPGARLEVSFSVNRFISYGIQPSTEPMPDACVAAIQSDDGSPGVACFAQGPLPVGNYVWRGQAFTALRCLDGSSECDCTPDDRGICVTGAEDGAGELITAGTMGTLPTPWVSVVFP